MSDIVIRVENLYKEYRLGTISHGTLTKDLQGWWARMRGKEDPNSIIGIEHRAKRKELNAMPSAPGAMRDNPHFLALSNVSFEVKRGEVLGIIGRNGAGKSTLLKILSEVTSPTKGTVKIKGRVSSLLEVGTGFHPELTGRENVYLNGAILGMTKKEIDKKFEEIVDFAEVEKFIDTPIKRYSSGMYVRLAFAVAAHLDSEILIVDEALAVGDARFQKKCYDKMNSLKKAGTTIIIVTHAHDIIKTFSSRALLLDAGRILLVGDPEEVVLRYMQLSFPEMTEQKGATRDELGFSGIKTSDLSRELEVEKGYCLEIMPSKDDEAKSFGAGGAWINWMKIWGLEKPNIFHGGEKMSIRVSISWDAVHLAASTKKGLYDNNLIVGIAIENQKGVALTSLATPLAEAGKADIDPYKSTGCILNYNFIMPPLAAGEYFISPGIVLGRMSHLLPVRRYGNIVQLTCSPAKEPVFGIMNWSVDITMKGAA